MERILVDFLSVSVGAIFVVPLVYYVYTLDPQHLSIWIGIVRTTLISEFIKYGVVGKRSLRPRGASNCNLCCTDGNCEDEPGMPSSHSAMVTYFALAYTFYLIRSHSELMLIAAIGLVLYAGLVMLSRYLKRCHTIYQIGAGAILGTVSYLYF